MVLVLGDGWINEGRQKRVGGELKSVSGNYVSAEYKYLLTTTTSHSLLIKYNEHAAKSTFPLASSRTYSSPHEHSSLSNNDPDPRSSSYWAYQSQFNALEYISLLINSWQIDKKNCQEFIDIGSKDESRIQLLTTVI